MLLSKTSRKDAIAGYLFVAPALLLFLLFQIYPLFRTAVLSFKEFVDTSFVPVGLANYVELAHDPVFLRSLLNSTLFVAVNVPVIVVFALVVSFAIYRTSRRVLSFYRIAFYLPSVASIVTICIVWKNLLNPIYGLIVYLLGRLGVPPVYLLGAGYAFWTICLILFFINVGMSIILYVAAMQGISQEVTEAALIDGANRTTLFLKVIVPLVRPTTLFVIIINTINMFQSFALVNLLTKGGPNYTTTTIVFQLYNAAFWLQRYGLASAMGLVLGLIISVISVFQFTLTEGRAGR